jgi:predicted DNA-binding protein YlxM (UPF0122 family)
MAGGGQMPRKSTKARPNDAERSVDHRPQRLDVTQVWKLRVVNRLSLSEIARSLGVAKSSVHAALQRLQKLIPDPDMIKAYEEVRPTLLTAVEQRLMASLMDEVTLQKASLNNRAYAFQQVFTARRLETGQSTQNHAVLGKLMAEALQSAGRPKHDDGEAEEKLGQ